MPEHIAGFVTDAATHAIHGTLGPLRLALNKLDVEAGAGYDTCPAYRALPHVYYFGL
jgi:hypothetical protein